MKYNDPFYFALPRGARQHHLGEALAHIADQFGIQGRVEFVRRELAFDLFKVTAA